MQIAIKKFVLDDVNYSFDHGDMTVCRYILRRFFDLPLDVRTIWISSHNRPSSMRHKARVFRDTDGDACIQLADVTAAARETRRWGVDSIFPIFQRLVGKTVYVQVEYEE